MSYLAKRIRRQWEAARPRMVAKLKAQGDWEEAVKWADRQATQELVWLMQRGTQWWQAEEVALAPFMLPSEKEQKTLTQDQMPFLSVE